MAPNFLALATTLENLGARWLLAKKVNFVPCQELPPNKSGRSFEEPIKVTSRGPTHSSFDKDETDLVQDARCKMQGSGLQLL